MRSNYFHILLFIFLGTFLKAQNFSHEGALQGIEHTGYYKISLSPEQKKYMTKDLRDVRVLDSADHEVAYYYLSEGPLKKKESFLRFDIIYEKHFKNCCELLVKTALKNTLTNFAFTTSSPSNYTYCSIEGSNDSLQWSAIINAQKINLIHAGSYDSVYYSVYCPLNEFLYYRVKLEGHDSDSLKITSAGSFKNSLLAGETFPLKCRSLFTIDDEKKISVVRLSFDTNQQIDRLSFRINDTSVYTRHVTIYANKTEQQKHKIIHYRDNLFEFDLSSGTSSLIDVPAINEKEIFIEIENKDLPPLSIESISCQQFKSYLICYLDSLTTYTLKCGNPKLRVVNYDPDFFGSPVPQLLPELAVSLKEIPFIQPNPLPKKLSFFETKTYLWMILVLGALTIIFFSVFLLKDMGKKF